jgi:hypothetical protein
VLADHGMTEAAASVFLKQLVEAVAKSHFRFGSREFAPQKAWGWTTVSMDGIGQLIRCFASDVETCLLRLALHGDPLSTYFGRGRAALRSVNRWPGWRRTRNDDRLAVQRRSREEDMPGGTPELGALETTAKSFKILKGSFRPFCCALSRGKAKCWTVYVFRTEKPHPAGTSGSSPDPAAKRGLRISGPAHADETRTTESDHSNWRQSVGRDRRSLVHPPSPCTPSCSCGPPKSCWVP